MRVLIFDASRVIAVGSNIPYSAILCKYFNQSINNRKIMPTENQIVL
jgi:hypothetical protein